MLAFNHMENSTETTPAQTVPSSSPAMQGVPTSGPQTVSITPDTSSNWGCLLLAGFGCLGLLAIFGLLIAGIILALVASTSTAEPINYNYNYNTNQNYGIENIQPLSATAQAYQIVAYPEFSYSTWTYPSIQAKLPYAKTTPLTDGDYGHLWVGAKLDNGYFIQVGMASSNTVDAEGNMEWNYFWEVWNDQNEYIYGYQDAMAEEGWDANADNTFSLTCQNPDAGTWEFWVNEQVVGTTTTGDCAVNLHNASVTWELVTEQTPGGTLPTFGPFQLGQMQYWDGYNWLDVPGATLTYGYGYIKNGTARDQASVCPPYGVTAAAKGSSLFSAGSGLTCLEQGAQLWSL